MALTPATGPFQGPIFEDFHNFMFRLRQWDAFCPAIARLDPPFDGTNTTIVSDPNAAMTLEEAVAWYDAEIRKQPPGVYCLQVVCSLAFSAVGESLATTQIVPTEQMRTVTLEETC